MEYVKETIMFLLEREEAPNPTPVSFENPRK